MSDLKQLLARCSPEERARLVDMLRARAAGAEPAPALPRGEPPAAEVETRFVPDANAHHWSWTHQTPKHVTAERYDEYHARCNATVFGRHSFFMNLGYLENDNPQYSPIVLPRHMVNRNSAKLVLETIGACDLTGRDVLDVGCGRGGIVHLVQTYYRPASTVGLDLSPGAIDFCRRTHRFAGARFVQGDAEQLPFADESFDAVTNVESSHSYPNVFAFYGEVYRVLRTGGDFLYTDILPVARLDEYRAFWRDLGFAIQRDQDVTSNVLASCDQSAQQQYGVFARDARDQSMANALGVPGSDIYERMKDNTSSFRILRLHRP